MRTIGWTAVVAGVLAFSGPALAQSCGGFFHTASEADHHGAICAASNQTGRSRQKGLAPFCRVERAAIGGPFHLIAVLSGIECAPRAVGLRRRGAA